jgi:hypothetical protein
VRGAVVESIFSEVTVMLSSGAGIVVKMLFLYMVLPEIIVMIIVGGVFKVRGKLFSAILTGVALLGLYLFSVYGLPQMNEEVKNLTQ